LKEEKVVTTSISKAFQYSVDKFGGSRPLPVPLRRRFVFSLFLFLTDFLSLGQRRIRQRIRAVAPVALLVVE
jgi:hypothetical protein